MRGLRGLGAWALPTGRMRRSDWWLRYVLVIALLGTVASVVDAQWFPDSGTTFQDREGAGDLADLLWLYPARGGPLTAAVALLALAPYVAATVTRLHDRDHSAWWLLWLLLGPLGVLVLFVTCGLLGTRPQANTYGPPPRG